ncbi:hypothetical protein BpHYR1_005534 [Brachionus plicatilis]|uniref:Uncharacterized protein n=1 Tax=Brachionus plicatilis TaxID=10195 RepID=A0A3M7Q9V6_BRAPC|nr:hypothetical protein BpHYR1_005534 [Brachionus plicatilis]
MSILISLCYLTCSMQSSKFLIEKIYENNLKNLTVCDSLIIKTLNDQSKYIFADYGPTAIVIHK